MGDVSPFHPECRLLPSVLRALTSIIDGQETGQDQVFEMRDDSDRRVTTVKKLDIFTDSDWACDQVTRKSTIGAVIMAEGVDVKVFFLCNRT